MRPKGLKDRFLSKVKKMTVEQVRGLGPCWEWQGNIHRDTGYGTFRARSKTAWAHRISWELHRGVIPPGKFVLHRCDNRRCVNPAHLFLGTHADNMADMDAKGRRARGEALASRGEGNGNAKLTQAEADAIRKSGLSSQELADKYGVHRSQIWRIRRAKVWLAVAPEEVKDGELRGEGDVLDPTGRGSASGE